MKILLQFPEGLKKEALGLVKKYEAQGHEVLLSGSPCYGACDLALEEAKAAGADKIIHFGHAKFVRDLKVPFEVEYVEWKVDVDLGKFGEAIKSMQFKNFKKIALATTVQHVHQIDEMRKALEADGKDVFVGKGTFAFYPGQVLGCDAGAVSSVAKDADAIFFVGDGNFHALAIDSKDSKFEKPVFVIHPKSGDVRQINHEIERLRKRRRGSVLAAVDAKTFGIIVSTKPGQFNMALANAMKKELVSLGKGAEILICNEISASALNNFSAFDCYVTSACPRLADDSEMFGKPMLDAGMFAEFMSITKSMKA